MRSAILSSSIFSVLFLLGSSSDSKATIIEDLIGDVAFAPVSVTLDTPDAATNINGVVHVVGQHDGKAARQLIDLATGTVGQVEFFDSLLSAQGNGGNTAGIVRAVHTSANGEVLYVGESFGTTQTSEPTYWRDLSSPATSFIAGGLQGGFLHATSSDSTFVGSSGAGANVYGRPGDALSILPGLEAGAPVDISLDGTLIVGSGGQIWSRNATGSYDALDTSSFNFTDSNGVPSWVGVAIDPVVGDAVFAGKYFDLNTFSETVGFWRADGAFLGASGVTEFKDFEVWEGQLVAGLNGADDGLLLSISDFSLIALESILGVKSLLYDDGLFIGSAGMLTQSASGAFLTTRFTHDPNGGGTEVPEPASLMLIGSGLALVSMKRRSQRH